MDVRVEGMVSKSSSRTDVAADYVDVLSNGDLASGASRPPFWVPMFRGRWIEKVPPISGIPRGRMRIAISVAFIWSAGNDMPYPGRERPCHYTIWLPGLARLAYLSYPANSQVFGVKVAMASRP